MWSDTFGPSLNGTTGKSKNSATERHSKLKSTSRLSLEVIAKGGDTMKIEVKYANIDELQEVPEVKQFSTPWTDKEKTIIKESFQKDGFNPGISRILVTQDMKVIDGYKRLALAREIGIEKIPVQIYQVDPDNFRAKGIDEEIANIRLIEIALQRNIGHNLSPEEVEKIQDTLQNLKDKKKEKEKESNKILKDTTKVKIAV